MEFYQDNQNSVNAHLQACHRLNLVSFQRFDYYGKMENKHVIAALAALAQESRLAIFRLLVQTGPEGLSATKIAETLEIPPSSLSFHLKELTHADIVTQKKSGRFLIYSANFATMNGLLGFLTANCCGGNVCSPVRVADCSKTGAC
jgi:ArsR family transcriptional regulator